jgi:hypothetical protein
MRTGLERALSALVAFRLLWKVQGAHYLVYGHMSMYKRGPGQVDWAR